MATIVPINTDPSASVLGYRASLGLGTSILTGTLNATNVNTTTLAATNVNATTVTLGAPLSLSTVAPASFSDLGYTSNISTNPSVINMVTGTFYVLGTTTLTLPGIYLVTALVGINIPATTSVSNVTLYHAATPNCSVNFAFYNVIPYGPTVFSAANSASVPLSCVLVVQSPASTVCTLSARITFTGGTTPYILANTSPGATYTITRIG